jgi:hypothetical protein
MRQESHSLILLPDQGYLYPLGGRRDKHVTGGARTSAPLHRRRMLFLKGYLDSLYAGYSEPPLGLSLTTTAGPLHAYFFLPRFS